MSKSLVDFLIIGAGIIGITIANEIKRRYPQSRIIILEKEKTLGEHASGRNSGVIHAGFYYSKDSLKAKFTKLGNEALTAYCLEKRIPLNRCGKLVVARHEQDLMGLEKLLNRGIQNGIALHSITAKEALAIEPRVKTFEKALFSPTTSSVNPKQVLNQMALDAKQQEIEIHFDTRYLKNINNTVLTNKGYYQAGFIVNTAGLYADKIAKNFGFSQNYTILPFKGLYLYANEGAEKFNTHIYPVPDLHNPFLGVHFTIGFNGAIKIGPTAIPALWREQYDGLSQFSFKELFDITLKQISLFFNAGFDFKRLAWTEIRKYNKSILTKHAAELAQGISKTHYKIWGKPGIRAQLMNVKTKKLEMDFIFEGDKHSFHVLNAVSPAFTCSIPFSNYAVDCIEKSGSG